MLSGGNGVLQHHGTVLLHRAAEAHRLGQGHAPVDLQHEVEVGADGLPADADLFQLVLDAAGEELIHAAVGAADGAVDKDLGRREALLLQVAVALGQGVGVVLLGHIRGIDPHLVPDAAAQQLVHRHAEGLALDVPQGDVHRRDGGHDDRTPEILGAVEILADVLNTEGVLADEIGLEFFNGGRRGAEEAPVARLAQADDAGVGVDLDEEVMLGVNQLQIGDFQRDLLPFSRDAHAGTQRAGRRLPPIRPCGWW